MTFRNVAGDDQCCESMVVAEPSLGQMQLCSHRWPTVGRDRLSTNVIENATNLFVLPSMDDLL